MPRFLHPFYFGCYDDTGHFWWEQASQKSDVLVRSHGRAPSLLRDVIDGLFCPPDGTAEGLANHAYLNVGHEPATVLSFWDNSVDSRPGSHSTFLLPGHLDFDVALALARAAFPEVFARFKFSVVAWKH